MSSTKLGYCIPQRWLWTIFKPDFLISCNIYRQIKLNYEFVSVCSFSTMTDLKNKLYTSCLDFLCINQLCACGSHLNHYLK